MSNKQRHVSMVYYMCTYSTVHMYGSCGCIVTVYWFHNVCVYYEEGVCVCNTLQAGLLDAQKDQMPV